MGILCDRLPDSVTVCGRKIPLETDFRRWILLTELMADDGASPSAKLRCAARIVCRGREELPLHDGAFAEAFWRGIAEFAALGKPLPKDGREQEEKNARGREPAFDFEFDGDRIYAAFRQVYGIDLCDEALHWWKFLTLLRHLPGECEFMRVVQLRQCDLSRIEDENIRRQLRRARAAVRIRKLTEKRRPAEETSNPSREREALHG